VALPIVVYIDKIGATLRRKMLLTVYGLAILIIDATLFMNMSKIIVFRSSLLGEKRTLPIDLLNV
jgi:hypothetical protein